MDLVLGFPLTNPYRSHSRSEYDPIRGHTGVDVGAPLNSPVTFPLPLKILALREQPQMGKVLYAQDAQGFVVVFAHLNTFLVEVGAKVEAGTILAHSGNTGTATSGPHLHFEVIAAKSEPGGETMYRGELPYKGYNIDPLAYLKSLENKGHWSDEAMEWALKEGLIREKHPANQTVTWGEFVEVLYNLVGNSGFEPPTSRM